MKYEKTTCACSDRKGKQSMLRLVPTLETAGRALEFYANDVVDYSVE